MASGIKSFFSRSGKKGKRNSSDSAFIHYFIIFTVCAVLLLVGLTKIYLQSKITHLGLGLEKQNLQLEMVQAQYLLL